MIRLLAALALALPSVPAIAAGRDAAQVRVMTPPPRPGWFVCDGIDGPFAALFGARDGTGRSVVTLVDRAAGRTTTSSVMVGAGDPGAGQVHYALTRDGREVGNVHMVNPGMVGDPILPAVTGVDLDGRHLECRFMPDMRLLGIGPKRSVMVRGQGAGLVYESFDYRARGAVIRPDGVHRSNRPSLSIAGGVASAGGFGFVNKGVAYAVSADAVVATRAGKVLARDGFLGSERVASQAMAAIGADAVWSAGASFGGCRQAATAALRACLIDAMERGGATPAAVSFTQRLADRGDFGFLTGWRQAGPVGIATITLPFRANSNTVQAIMPPAGAPIFVDEYRPAASDTARPDWRAFARGRPGAFPVTPAKVSAPKIAAGMPVTIRARYAMATCRACAVLGELTVAWRFDAEGRPLGAAVERIGQDAPPHGHRSVFQG